MRSTRYFLTAQTSIHALKAIDGGQCRVQISLDLELSKDWLLVEKDSLRLPNLDVLRRETLEQIARFPARVFMLERGDPRPVEVVTDHYYKLCPTGGAPTLEIDGVKMHRTDGCDPFLDSRKKASAVVRRDHTTLDTCAGLGYTAIWAVRLGASRVISVECDANVIEIARLNPWSAEFFESKAVDFRRARVEELVTTFDADTFDSVIHDPPRFSRAGELYGESFYREIRRVLKKGGWLYHYTGNPFSRYRKRRFIEGIARRLRNSGFDAIFRKDLQGFLAN